ncbi:MAG: photosystem II stability/assembly factor-like uncharacterized protein [Bradymonadia bacterium]
MISALRRAASRAPALMAALWAMCPTAALAHGGQPQIIDITFMPQAPGVAWAITDNQGLFVDDGARTRWLCEDSIEPGESVRALAVLGEGRDTWALSTDLRLYLTTDGGCTFEPLRGALAGQRSRAISVHPDNPDEAVIGTDTLGGALNDVWRTTDAGDTWLPAGLDLPSQIVEMHRAPADPRRLYVLHERGGERSDDGGARFDRFKLGPAALEARPEEFRLLGTSPVDATVLFAAIERFDTILIRSDDGGDTWEELLRVPDFPLTLVMAADGQRAILHSPFEGIQRSADGGLTWRPEASPVDRLGCLRRAPGGDRLWGCTNVFFGGPWALGVSDDFGVTWAPRLEAFEGARRWDCPVRSLGRDCCQNLCPGLPPGGVCESAAANPGPTCGGPEPTLDMGVVMDAGLDAGQDAAGVTLDLGTDAGVPVDATLDAAVPVDAQIIDAATVIDDARAPVIDATIAPDMAPKPPPRGTDDCATMPEPAGGSWWLVGVGLALGVRRRGARAAR